LAIIKNIAKYIISLSADGTSVFVDVVAVLTESADPKQYIKKMRSRDPELNSKWGTICTPTRIMASDGKWYNTQAADMQVCDNNRQSQLNKHCKMRRSRRVGG